MESIVVALITGACTIVGVVITNAVQNQQVLSELQKNQAVTDQKIEDLTREVRAHNEFARRIPVLEEQMRVANHRISDLEDDRK